MFKASNTREACSCFTSHTYSVVLKINSMGEDLNFEFLYYLFLKYNQGFFFKKKEKRKTCARIKLAVVADTGVIHRGRSIVI